MDLEWSALVLMLIAAVLVPAARVAVPVSLRRPSRRTGHGGTWA